MNRQDLKPTGVILLIALTLSCQKTIYQGSDIDLTNDLFHGDIVGTVKQKDAGAQIIVSQVEPVDSTQIDPLTGNFGLYDLRLGNYDLTILADGYRTYRHRNVMVYGGGSSYLGEVDLSTVPDLVSQHYPEDMDEIVYSRRGQRLSISILFTQDMDRESVEEAFSTDPPTEGTFHWGQYTPEPTDRYFFDEYAKGDVGGGATITTYSKISSVTYRMAQKDGYPDTTYHVTLSTEAHDTAGVQLRFPLEFSFSTVQSAVSYSGIQSSPFHGDIDVGPLTNSFIVTFPRRMDQVTTEAAVSVTPAQQFFFVWPQRNVLKIYTGEPLYADTTYEITIAASALDLDGLALGDEFSFSFETAPVRVTSTTPSNAEVYVNPDHVITFWFNTFMVKSTVAGAFTIDPAISGTFTWGTRYSDNDKRAITFRPNGNLRVNTKYNLTLSPAASDLHGTGLKEAFSFTFITRPEL